MPHTGSRKKSQRRSWARPVFAPLAVSRHAFSAPPALELAHVNPWAVRRYPCIDVIAGMVLPLYSAHEKPFSIKVLLDVQKC
jgi:hypothetical protein